MDCFLKMNPVDSTKHEPIFIVMNVDQDQDYHIMIHFIYFNIKLCIAFYCALHTRRVESAGG